jgi:hypothetical protein
MYWCIQYDDDLIRHFVVVDYLRRRRMWRRRR